MWCYLRPMWRHFRPMGSDVVISHTQWYLVYNLSRFFLDNAQFFLDVFWQQMRRASCSIRDVNGLMQYMKA